MAVYTNITRRLINLPDGTQCIPGSSGEVSDDIASNEGFKALVDSGDIVAGAVAPDKLEEIRQERETKQQEQQQKAQEESRAPQQQPAPQQQSRPNPPPTPATKA